MARPNLSMLALFYSSLANTICLLAYLNICLADSILSVHVQKMYGTSCRPHHKTHEIPRVHFKGVFPFHVRRPS